jgi:hypothetical protein
MRGHARTRAITYHLVPFRWARFAAAQALLRFTRLRGHARPRAVHRFPPLIADFRRRRDLLARFMGAASDVGDHVGDRRCHYDPKRGALDAGDLDVDRAGCCFRAINPLHQ